MFASLALTSCEAASPIATTQCVRPSAREYAEGESVTLSRDSDYPCRLELVETGLVLRSDLAGTIPDPGENVVMNKAGRIYSSSSIPGAIAVWNPDGSFDRTFGSQGEGPEEFRRGQFMLFLDGMDRLHVLSGYRQWSVLTPELEWVSRVLTMPIRVDDDFTIVTPDGMVVTSSPDETWFATADAQANAIATFGDYSGGIDSRSPEDHRRMIAWAGNDRFWATPEVNSKDGYSMELWDLDGVRHLTFQRDVPWYPRGTGLPAGPRERPPPYIVQVHAATTGLLFTVTMVATENWDRLASAPSDQIRAIAAQSYTAYIDVIDARAGAVLASERFDPPVAIDLVTRFMPGRRMAYRHVETPDGLREVRFLELHLTGS